MRNQGSKSRPQSQGGKVVTCVRCQGDIQPYAGRSVALIRDQYAHHPGQCADVAKRSAEVRELAGQESLFGWRCDHIEPGDVTGYVCAETGTDRADYVAHMKASHGQRPMKGADRIRLRKTAPGASLAKLEVNPFKFATWTERVYGEWKPGIGTPLLSETVRRGQFWSAGPDPHSFWYVPLEGDRRPVTLYTCGDGTFTRDWSAAAQSRREAKRHGLAA